MRQSRPLSFLTIKDKPWSRDVQKPLPSDYMHPLFVGHVTVFALTALACLGSVPRARTIQHPETRTGLVTLLATSGIWAGSHVGYLTVPSVPAKRGFYLLGLVAGLLAVGAWAYFATAYTGRQPRNTPSRWAVVSVILLLVGLKVTNPLHQFYFTATWQTTPFPHLAIEHGIAHWLAVGFAYAVASIGFFLLLERFYYVGTDTRPLAVLVGLTALPIGFNVLGVLDVGFLSMTYEPLGVAVFAVGVLFVYFDRFQTVRLTGGVEDPVVVLDRGDHIRDYSREASELFPALDNNRGQPLSAVVPALADRLDDEGVLTLEYNGKQRSYRVATNPFVTGETQTGRSVVVSDVTETERYREQLEETNEQLEALNRVVRHDIRNDMNVILSWSDLLDEHADKEDADALVRVREAAKHTVELTKISRDFVDSLAGEGAPDLKPIPLGQYLRTELDQRREAYPDAQFRIRGEIPAVSVRANELLSSVFQNLLNNAVQHNDETTPVVTVATDVGEETVRVRISDDGPGIPTEQRERVFGKNEKGLDSEGTGIGLYLVETLVEQYGGTVWLEHNEPKGTHVVLELPRVTTGTDGEDAHAASWADGSDGNV